MKPLSKITFTLAVVTIVAWIVLTALLSGCAGHSGTHGPNYWVPPPMEIETVKHLPSQSIDGCPLSDAGYDTAAGCHRSARSGALHHEAIYGESTACIVPATALQAHFIPPIAWGDPAARPSVSEPNSWYQNPVSELKGDGSLQCSHLFTSLNQGMIHEY